MKTILKTSLLRSMMLSVLMLPAISQASTWESLKEGAVQGWEKTKEVVTELTEETKEVVSDEENQETAKAIWENVKTDASRAWEVTKEGASVVTEKVVETGKEGIEKAKELAE